MTKTSISNKYESEEFASHVARVFSSTDSPYGHVDVEQRETQILRFVGVAWISAVSSSDLHACWNGSA